MSIAFQHGQFPWRQRQVPDAAFGLGGHDGVVAVDVHPGLPDVQGAGLQVYVAPAQAADFLAAQAQQRQGETVGQPVRGDVVEKVVHLFRGPDVARV